MRINIASPETLGGLEDKECGWIYADEYLDTFHHVRDRLKNSRPLVSSEVFQQTALELRAKFIGWVDECMSAVPPSYWLATPLKKDPDSRLFLHLVWMVLIDRAYQRGVREIIVVTKSNRMALALEEMSRVKGWKYVSRGKLNNLFRHWGRNLFAVRKWIVDIILLSYRIVVARSLFTSQFVNTKLARTDILVESYVFNGDLDAYGRYKDRFFPGLVEYYKSQGIRAGYFPLLFIVPFRRLRQTFLRMRSSEIPFVPYEAFVLPRDVAISAWLSLRNAFSTYLRFPLHFQGLPVSGLLRGECFMAGLRGFIPFVLSRAPGRIAKAGINPKMFIDWFENQTFDKGVVLGFKEGLPGCRIIGGKGSIFLSNYLSEFSSTGEVNAGVAPTENWVCGEAVIPVASEFDSKGKYSAVPALRFSYQQYMASNKAGGDDILVLLTYNEDESNGILDCFLPLLMDEKTKNVPIVIKTHPTTDIGVFRKKAEKMFPDLKRRAIDWSNRKVGELFFNAKIVVTSGTSAAVEAVCQGVPVVIIGRHAGLNFNPMSGINPKMWVVVYSSDDLKNAFFQKFSNEQLPFLERLAIAENTKKMFFMDTGDDNMRLFLPKKLKNEHHSVAN